MEGVLGDEMQRSHLFILNNAKYGEERKGFREPGFCGTFLRDSLWKFCGELPRFAETDIFPCKMTEICGDDVSAQKLCREVPKSCLVKFPRGAPILRRNLERVWGRLLGVTRLALSAQLSLGRVVFRGLVPEGLPEVGSMLPKDQIRLKITLRLN